ncbi:hypothetical protein [endosymbiont GvMRE of Glomus versiforme]|uniref:hypothetical protein n=1 Tax=endosymbiont GvMRE of Glomus versiforme TaxID=2039283 RepID=UPI000ECA3A4C|nr:hypothetical protein [endosymbiont GvMRE of Glomus versiforme]RHZ36708.1 hypothetical protein GvMRE_I2g64 [endosymbiont GvMRE of Glomus versiforme]
METHCDYSKWFYLCLALVFVVLAGLVMIFRYFLEIKRDSIKLGQHDKEQTERIKVLEKKNGHEEVELLKVEVNILKGIINAFFANQQTKPIINNPVQKTADIPTPPPMPNKEKESNREKKPVMPKQPEQKKPDWSEVHKLIRKRRKDLGEED